MSTMIVSGNKVLVQNMSVKGDKLPKDFQVYLDIEFDYTGIPMARILEVCSSGSSLRVRAQSKLRSKGPKWLRDHEGETIKMTFDEVIEKSEGGVGDKLAKLTREEFYNELKVYGVTKEQADAMYDKKHEIED